ncbi:MAG: pyridoxamine 5'-phosphate oxidase family protein [Planctomycetota bacterium]
MLNDQELLWIERSVLCWLATASVASGDEVSVEPSVSPKELWVAMPERVLIANVASAHSMRNVKSCGRVCVAFLDVFRQKGVQVYGPAEVVNKSDERFAGLATPLLEMAGEDFPFASLFLVTPERTREIVAPRYRLFPETTEGSQIESALDTYGVRALMGG